MIGSDHFFRALGVDPKSPAEIKSLSRETGIPAERLKYYNDREILPSGQDLQAICRARSLSATELMLALGRPDRKVLRAIQENAGPILKLIDQHGEVASPSAVRREPKKVFETKLGRLYEGDCVDLMKTLESDTADLIFADPPFNLNKLYPSKMNDDLKESQYLDWTENWLSECVRLLKPGGSLFVWNLPKWNTYVSHFLNGRLSFRHWIAVDIKYRLPIQGRLYPSHYSLLYYRKGEKQNEFHPDRLPMEVCRYCGEDFRDYGGYKDRMNPKGVNLSDVWYDISPVRHAKYKRRENSNELPLKLLDRIIEMSSKEGDLVFDPFGGSGTTYIVAEVKKRKWIGVEIGPTKEIIQRFKRLKDEKEIIDLLRQNYNCLFTDATLKLRRKRGLWTTNSVRKRSKTDTQLRLRID